MLFNVLIHTNVYRFQLLNGNILLVILVFHGCKPNVFVVWMFEICQLGLWENVILLTKQ